ncbi:MAG TPA: amidohydrolase family protein [Candidatus Faecousia excrementipullorum]|nr:amidohydrolase family protein [Candidatus Faecousia excrementipullorum]
MVDWKTLKKIDAHIHILPDDVHRANPDSEDVWVYAKLHEYRKKMDVLGVEKAVIMPLNDPWLMSMDFSIDAVHKNLYEMKQRYPGKFYAFADIDTRNTPQESVNAISKAIEEYGLDGIKIHPNNSGVALDSDYNRAIFAFAQMKQIPVAIHCYPNSDDDLSTAEQVVRAVNQYPDLTIIVSHMGAYQWERLLSANVYVDVSAALPDYVRKIGIEATKSILHKFGADRLIFATDYPDNRFLSPEEIYDTYFDALNQMDYTQEEAHKIAYDNLESMLTKKRQLKMG